MASPVYLFAPPATVTVPVRGLAELYPVRRIFCVGRNYAEHAREMGFDPDREPPFYFTKPADAIRLAGGTVAYPPATKNYHYEMELVVALHQPAFQVKPEAALDAVYGYAAGLDMTRRDLQFLARDKGRPWDLGKAFEDSAVIGDIVPASAIGHLSSGAIRLTVNGTVKQEADLKALIWSVPELIANLSQFYHLGAGDLIYTGTPAGVGAVVPGDKLVGHIDGIGEISCTIA